MNRMISPSAASISFSTAFSRSSNSPRYLAPATMAPRSSDSSCLFFSASGTSPLTMRSARPSTIAVLPTPGSPISTGLFLVRRASTWMVRRISSSRPITGSSLPSRARAVTSRAYFFSASKLASAFGLLTLRPLRMSATAFSSACGVTPAISQRPSRRRVGGGKRHQQPVLRHIFVARLVRGLLRSVQHAHQFGRQSAAGPRRRRCTFGLRATSASTATAAALDRRRRRGSSRRLRLLRHPAAPSADAPA